MKYYEATVSSKGQVTIPKELRETANIVEGSKLQFVLLRNGDFRVIPQTRNIMDYAGVLSTPGRAPVSIGDMNEGIAEAAARSGMAGLDS